MVRFATFDNDHRPSVISKSSNFDYWTVEMSENVVYLFRKLNKLWANIVTISKRLENIVYCSIHFE